MIRMPTLYVRALFMLLLLAAPLFGGGPKFVAGSSYFAPQVTGQPVLWPGGQVNYYTDQGDLSPVLPNAAANQLVADAFAVWTSVPTAALTVNAGGQLAEDVTGADLTLSNGVISAPLDIAPSATATPVGIVYDVDGSVTDALLGSGAGDVSQCFWNAVYGGADNFTADAGMQHALVVLNGQCAQQSSQLTDVQYRLVRTLGLVLGVGYSQLNVNVITNNPPATAGDLAGFPLMHFADEISCVPITACLPNPLQLAPDDVASVSRCYPVTAQNLSSFPNGQIFSSATGRIHGSVWFTGVSGNSTTAMQGVNVVARWLDPVTGLPSRSVAASAVSGNLFIGDAGNAVTGLNDSLGVPFAQWGSPDPSVEGFFDLSGLEFPGGATNGTFQLSVEALDPLWSDGVGPYAPWQVAPSGLAQPILLTLAPGQDLAQDILMSGSAEPLPLFDNHLQTWTDPAPVPAGGDWEGSLNPYGRLSYFSLTAQSNRTFSIAVTALDESQSPSEVKAQPVIGVWNSTDPQGTPPPALTSSPFNTGFPAISRLDAQIFGGGTFLVGIADVRGDGRPDYRYHAQVLYGDSVTPARISTAGAPVTVNGYGFHAGITVTSGLQPVPVLAYGADYLLIAAPSQSDGTQSFTISDPTTGGFSSMTGVLTSGAAAADVITLVQGSNPLTPVGTQATNAVIVRVVGSDGVTPVAGASIGWNASNGTELAVCGGASACSSVADDSGFALTSLVPTASGSSTITATLAPGVYSPPKSVQASLTASSSSSSADIAVVSPYVYVLQGATLNLPVIVRVVSQGTPQSGVTLNFSLSQGTATLSRTSAVTDPHGYASITAGVSQFASEVQISACVAPQNAPCQSFYANLILPSVAQLQPVSGGAQAILQGQSFAPVLLRVTDSATPPHPVMGAQVAFQATLMRPAANPLVTGDGGTQGQGEAVVLGVVQSAVSSGGDGIAGFQPSVGSLSGPIQVAISANIGNGAQMQYTLASLPPPGSSNGAAPPTNSPEERGPRPVAEVPTLPVRFNPEDDYPVYAARRCCSALMCAPASSSSPDRNAHNIMLTDRANGP